MQHLTNSVHHESAVSEVIGAVLLISVVVLAVAIIGVALTSQPAPQKLPAVSAVISSSGNQVSLYHDGGDSLASSDLLILVNGNPVPFTKSGSPAPWTWSTGDTLSYTLSSGTPQTVRIVYIPGSYTIASADFAYGGSGAVPTHSTPSTTTATPTPSTAPTVTGIIPPSGSADTTVSLTSIAGTNFVSGATVKLTRSGYADISISGSMVSSSIQITGGSVNLAGAAAGQWNVVVTNPDLQSGSLSNGFTVTRTAPAVSSIMPSAGTRGTTVSITNLAGTGFLSGATVRLNRTDSTPIPAINVVVVSATQITGEFVLPAGATVGTWDVIVTNPDTQTGMLANGFAVMAAGPTVTAISPNSSLPTTPVSVSVAGTGFQSGANLALKRTGYPDIVATGVVFGSSNLVTGNFNIMTATPGLWDVVVTNTDGQSGTLAGGFRVKDPTPTVTSITPKTGASGWPISITNLVGTNFRSGAAVKIVNASAGPDITATNVVVVSASQITCTFDLTGAAAAKRNVTVTNPYSDTGTLANGFTVTSPVPTFTSIAPSTGPIAGGTSVTITGTNLTGATSVTFGGTAATTFMVVSATQITATTPAHAAGAVNVVITTPGGTATGTGKYTYAAAPTFTSIAPTFGQTAGGTSVIITGTNLIGATAVTFGGTAATTFTVVSATKITATTPSHAFGAVNVVVITPNGTATRSYTYADVPAFVSIAPSTGPIVGGTSVTITGMNLTGATAVSFGGIAATTFTVVSAAQITATTPAHAAGAVNVVITTPGGTATGTGKYTYAAVPTFTSIAPISGPRTGGTSVTITGTGFTEATAVTFGGTAATTFTVVSATQITATTPAHATGAVNIVITTPGGTATGTNKYTYV